MILNHNNEKYIPIYRAENKSFVLDYDYLPILYHKTFKVQLTNFQSIYDCLSIQLLYWLNDFEEDRDKNLMDKMIYEFEGLDFYKFFYNDLEWYPYLILDKYDGMYLNDDEIIEVKYNLIQEMFVFNIENNVQLEISKLEFPQIFNCDIGDIDTSIIKLIKKNQLYFDGGEYFFINEKNYKRLMLYMIEQLKFLNEIYRYLNLRTIEIVEI